MAEHPQTSLQIQQSPMFSRLLQLTNNEATSEEQLQTNPFTYSLRLEWMSGGTAQQRKAHLRGLPGAPRRAPGNCRLRCKGLSRGRVAFSSLRMLRLFWVAGHKATQLTDCSFPSCRWMQGPGARSLRPRGCAFGERAPRLPGVLFQSSETGAPLLCSQV